LQSVKKTFLSRNLDQICIKMLYIWKKLKNRRNVRGSAPKLPLASGGWGLFPQTPRLSFPLNLRVIFEWCTYFSASLKLKLWSFVLKWRLVGLLAKLAPWLKLLVMPLSEIFLYVSSQSFAVVQLAGLFSSLLQEKLVCKAFPEAFCLHGQTI